MKDTLLEIQVKIPTDEAEIMLNWLAANDYLLYWNVFEK